MNNNYYDIAKKIGELAIIPVIKMEKEESAEPLGQALVNSKLFAAEVTFRTEAAAGAIKILSEKYPQLLVGAGTVLTPEQAQAAFDAGAKFVVSPGFNPRVVDYCIENSIPIFPGVNNPTGIEMAMDKGLTVLKYFPAEASGGLNMLKAMSAPYNGVTFMATGGINSNNLTTYLDSPAILACGGSWMVKADLINSGKFDEIEKLCNETVNMVNNWRNK